MSDVYYEYKLGNKIFKFDDEILTVEGIKNQISYKNNILSNLITNLSIFNNFSSIDYDINKNKNILKKIDLIVLSNFPSIAYSVGNSKIINDFRIDSISEIDIHEKGRHEDENGEEIYIVREGFLLSSGITIHGLGMEIHFDLFNKVCGNVFNNVDRHILTYDIKRFIPDENPLGLYNNVDDKNNIWLYKVILKMNNEILSILEQITKYLDVRFYLREKDFSASLSKRQKVDENLLSDEYIEISEFLEKSSLFKKITDEKIIKNYEIKENFK